MRALAVMEMGGLTNFADPNVNYCKAMSYRRKLKAAGTSKRGNGILRPFPVERPETGNAGTTQEPIPDLGIRCGYCFQFRECGAQFDFSGLKLLQSAFLDRDGSSTVYSTTVWPLCSGAIVGGAVAFLVQWRLT